MPKDGKPPGRRLAEDVADDEEFQTEIDVGDEGFTVGTSTCLVHLGPFASESRERKTLSTSQDDLKQEVEDLKTAQATQTATQAGAQATQAATQAGTMSTMAATQI